MRQLHSNTIAKIKESKDDFIRPKYLLLLVQEYRGGIQYTFRYLKRRLAYCDPYLHTPYSLYFGIPCYYITGELTLPDDIRKYSCEFKPDTPQQNKYKGRY